MRPQTSRWHPALVCRLRAELQSDALRRPCPFPRLRGLRERMKPRYIAQRLLSFLPIVLGVTVICFALIYLGLVDPVTAVTPTMQTAEQIAMIRTLYGFDRPLPVQYLSLALAGCSSAISACLFRPAGRSWNCCCLPSAAPFGSPSWNYPRLLRRLPPRRHRCVLAWLLDQPVADGFLFLHRDQHLPGLLVGNCSGHRVLGRNSTWAACHSGNGARWRGAKQWSWDLEHVRHLVLPATAIAVILGPERRRDHPRGRARNAQSGICRGSRERGAWRPAHRAERAAQRGPDRARRLRSAIRGRCSALAPS